MILKMLDYLKSNGGYFDEEELREFYNLFGDNINIVVKYFMYDREVMTISDFYNLSEDYIKIRNGIREVYICSTDYRKLMQIRDMILN